MKRIRVVKPRLGGGFGSKQEMVIEDVVGHLVLATRRPVRLELTRAEEFAATRVRHAQTITFRSGIDVDGRLVAQDMQVVSNTGAYGTHGFTVNSVCGQHGLSLYNCPAKRFRCDVAYTNRPVAGAFRGYGAPQAFFALESHMDDIARALGTDPVELRRKNWVNAGDPLDIVLRLGERGGVEDIAPEDMPLVTSCGLEECALQGLRAIGWERRTDPSWRRPPERPNIRRGLGMALAIQGSGIPLVDMAACSIKINDDGSFNVLFGATDLGTGSDTVLAQIAAEVLGVPVEDILVYSSDTDFTPFDVGAYASSTTYISGMAVKKAAEAARARIVARAARLLGGRGPGRRSCSTTAGLGCRRTLGVARGHRAERVAHRGPGTDHGHRLARVGRIAAAVRRAARRGGGGRRDRPGDASRSSSWRSTAACRSTRSRRAARWRAAMLQALGYALCEEVVLDAAGRMVNAGSAPTGSSGPTTRPRRRSTSCRRWSLPAPTGPRPSAEIPIDDVAPAVRNAVLDATGVAINSLPLTPERVWRALRAGQEEPS